MATLGEMLETGVEVVETVVTVEIGDEKCSIKEDRRVKLLVLSEE